MPNKARLKAFIKQSGKTAEIVAKEMGRSRQSLSEKMNGKREFTYSEMKSFAAAVGKSPAEVFFSE